MSNLKIGFLTIGQSPRKDVMTDIKYLLLPHITVVERGLLDYLTTEEIMILKPKNNEIPLVTRLRDGNQVYISEKKVIELLPSTIDFMKTELNVKAVAFLCTHTIPKITISCPTIFPSDYLRFLINQILKAKYLGVVVPLDEQVEMTKTKWKKEKIVVQVKSPYDRRNNWEEIAQRFNQEKVEAVILDCIGYNITDGRELQHLLSVPVLLPRTILAFAINQIFYFSI
ncbi:MAG: AroM family protein [Asgard group archaeon]|nr:AroM family protein [Asgard group archaeon]